jgi:hypothetical protein
MAVHKRTKPETYSSVKNAVMYVPVQLVDKDRDTDHTPRFLSQLCNSVCARACKCACACLCIEIIITGCCSYYYDMLYFFE